MLADVTERSEATANCQKKGHPEPTFLYDVIDLYALAHVSGRNFGPSHYSLGIVMGCSYLSLTDAKVRQIQAKANAANMASCVPKLLGASTFRLAKRWP